jgi:hypothetical protein
VAGYQSQKIGRRQLITASIRQHRRECDPFYHAAAPTEMQPTSPRKPALAEDG